MARYSLPDRPARHAIDYLLAAWNPAYARGYDITVSTPSAEAFCPIATSLDDVGSSHPSIVVTASQPGGTAGESTWDFVTSNGPGQNRQGTLLATIRAQDRDDDSNTGYTGDSATYSGVSATEIVEELADAVERVVMEDPVTPQATQFSYLGSQRPADVPDDFEDSPPTRLAQVELRFGWIRTPV